MSMKDKFGVPGDKLMGDKVKSLLKNCGHGVEIRPLAKIANPHMVEIGDYSIVDDFAFLAGGEGVTIGKFVHISSFCSILGGGTLLLDDFSGLAAGCRIITGTDDFTGRSLTNPCVHKDFKPLLHKGRVIIGKHTILGTNTVVHPDVTIGAYSATASGTIVTKDLEREGIYKGIPAEFVKKRNASELKKLEKMFLTKIYTR